MANAGVANRSMVVLVADDDEDDRALTRDALLQVDSRSDVRFVQDGQELLDYLRGYAADEADVVLLDLNMPRMNGKEALSEIRGDDALRALPVVVFTTSRADQDIRDCYRRGANSFISKPNSFAGLVDAMRTFREYWAGLVDLPTR
jgi:CheY-like chemotaxis protein